jgi:hypothetical protein
MEDLFVPLAFFATAFGIIWVIFSSRNRERMAMIEKGVSPKDFNLQQKSSVFGILKWGLLLAGVGFGIFVGSLLDTYTEIAHEAAYFACALLFGGLGLLLAFLITKKGSEKEQE